MVLFWNKITQVWQVRKLDFVNFVLQFNLRISPNKFGLTWLWGKKRNPKPHFTDLTANITNSKYYQINWDKRTKVLLKSYKTEHFQAHLTFHWEGKKQRKSWPCPISASWWWKGLRRIKYHLNVTPPSSWISKYSDE